MRPPSTVHCEGPSERRESRCSVDLAYRVSVTAKPQITKPGGLMKPRPDDGRPAELFQVGTAIAAETIEISAPHVPRLWRAGFEIGKRDAHLDRPALVAVRRVLNGPI